MFSTVQLRRIVGGGDAKVDRAFHWGSKLHRRHRPFHRGSRRRWHNGKAREANVLHSSTMENSREGVWRWRGKVALPKFHLEPVTTSFHGESRRRRQDEAGKRDVLHSSTVENGGEVNG